MFEEQAKSVEQHFWICRTSRTLMQGTESNHHLYRKLPNLKVFDFNSDGRDETCSFEGTWVKKSRSKRLNRESNQNKQALLDFQTGHSLIGEEINTSLIKIISKILVLATSSLEYQKKPGDLEKKEFKCSEK